MSNNISREMDKPWQTAPIDSDHHPRMEPCVRSPVERAKRCCAWIFGARSHRSHRQGDATGDRSAARAKFQLLKYMMQRRDKCCLARNLIKMCGT